jgi:hypothetical protein
MTTRHFLIAVFAASIISGCVSTAMQGYADRDLPTQPVTHIAALVVGPTPLVQSMQSNILTEAAKRGIAVDDALTLFPPTRQYTDSEIKRDLASDGVNGLLIINVGDSGIQQQYADTVFSSSSSGMVALSSTGPLTTGSYSGTTFGSAHPVFRYSRQTDFTARLVDPQSGRNLWVGNGEVDASGRGLVGSLFVGNGVAASNSIAAVFNDIQSKGLFGRSS